MILPLQIARCEKYPVTTEARVGFQLSPQLRNLRKSLEATVGIGRLKRRFCAKNAQFCR